MTNRTARSLPQTWRLRGPRHGLVALMVLVALFGACSPGPDDGQPSTTALTQQQQGCIVAATSEVDFESCLSWPSCDRQAFESCAVAVSSASQRLACFDKHLVQCTPTEPTLPDWGHCFYAEHPDLCLDDHLFMAFGANMTEACLRVARCTTGTAVEQLYIDTCKDAYDAYQAASVARGGSFGTSLDWSAIPKCPAPPEGL